MCLKSHDFDPTAEREKIPKQKCELQAESHPCPKTACSFRIKCEQGEPKLGLPKEIAYLGSESTSDDDVGLNYAR